MLVCNYRLRPQLQQQQQQQPDGADLQGSTLDDHAAAVMEVEASYSSVYQAFISGGIAVDVLSKSMLRRRMRPVTLFLRIHAHHGTQFLWSGTVAAASRRHATISETFPSHCLLSRTCLQSRGVVPRHSKHCR